MVGQSHHIVRPPDMAAQAFADLREDLKAGRRWRGLASYVPLTTRDFSDTSDRLEYVRSTGDLRKLAERTTRATQGIANMTLSIQNETQTAVAGMRSGAQQVAEGVQLVNATEESLRQINLEMVKTTDMVGEISHASNEQQSAMVELAQNVERVANMTEQNVVVVNQSSATVDRLNAVVTRMRKSTMQFGI